MRSILQYVSLSFYFKMYQSFYLDKTVGPDLRVCFQFNLPRNALIKIGTLATNT